MQPIVQFLSAQACGCPTCWRRADRPTRCAAHAEKKWVFYESRLFMTSVRLSRDGRYAYTFGYAQELLIVDLLRKRSKVVKPDLLLGSFKHPVEDFLVVDSFTVVVLKSYRIQLELHLIRLAADSDAFEHRLVHRLLLRFSDDPTILDGGEVRHAILGEGSTLTFVRLDVAAEALEAIPSYSCRSPHAFYGHAVVPSGETNRANSPLFRFDPERRKWEEVAARVPRNGRLHPIVHPTDGTEDGVVAIETSNCRFKVQRFEFRRPDSLQALALVAAQKLREGVQVEEIFCLANGKASQCTSQQTKEKARKS
ncbi:hypothetical protein M3Y99_00574700 [Aphelenchoides fujianensis]|nr:hypothetical protein M3Y99_00574700 [Aphelenchoides fujianensis]